MSEGMATPESGTGKYYNEKKPNCYANLLRGKRCKRLNL